MPKRRAADKSAETETADDVVQLGSELSFPASDPPAYMGGAAIAGPPPRKPREVVRSDDALD